MNDTDATTNGENAPGPGRPPATPEDDAERLRVHAAYCRRIGRHTLARALDRGADLIDAATTPGRETRADRRIKDMPR